MMYPVLAKVRYTEIGRITADRRMMTVSLLLNWIIDPAVMFVLAWLFLPNQPANRTGVVLVGADPPAALRAGGEDHGICHVRTVRTAQLGQGSYLKAASFRGLICFGPGEGGNVTFTNPRSWVRAEAPRRSIRTMRSAR